MVNVQQIQMGVTKYVEAEIATKATGFTKFATYFVLPKLSVKVVDLINQYKTNPIAKDYFDADGNVDLDSIYNTAKTAIAHSGQFTLYGIIFNETDIDKLYNYIKNTTI